MPSPAAQVAREAEIRTQEALEAELKSAVDELNGRVRGILVGFLLKGRADR